jgi:integrase
MGTFEPADWGLLEASANSMLKRLPEWVEYIEDLPAKDLAPASKVVYRIQANRILALAEKPETAKLLELDIRKVDFPDYKAIFDALSGRNSAKKTLRSVIRLWLTWCRSRRYILTMPLLPTLKGGDSKTKYVLTAEQQDQALARLPEARRDLYGLLMNCGARVSEICTLQVKDVNLERRVVTIRRTWSARQLKESTKTNKERTLPLTATAVEILTRATAGKVGAAFIFTNASGEPYQYGFLDAEWKAKSGFAVPLKDATRRSWATRMRNAGVPIEAISKGLGHSTISTTERYLDEDVEWARDLFDKAEIMRLKPRNERGTKKGGNSLDFR